MTYRSLPPFETLSLLFFVDRQTSTLCWRERADLPKVYHNRPAGITRKSGGQFVKVGGVTYPVLRIVEALTPKPAGFYDVGAWVDSTSNTARLQTIRSKIDARLLSLGDAA